MDINELRLANFNFLLERFQKSEADQGIAERGYLARFANQIGISKAYASHINTGYKAVGAKTARTIEENLKLPHGWMDMDNIDGAVPMDKKAKEFGNLAMRLYRADPEGTRAALMAYMESKIFEEKPANPKKPK